jgi:hypothetical protein
MKRAALTLVALLLLGMSAFADTFRVTYTYAGLIKRITVLAESSQEARRTVQAMFPGSYVTGVQQLEAARK